MKPRNREISVFNLSMLDVISGAVGAFLIITVVLFPSYGRNVEIGEERLIELERVRRELIAAREKLGPKADVDAQEVRRENQVLKERIAARRQSGDSEKGEPLLFLEYALGSGGRTQLAVLPDLPGVPTFDPQSHDASRDASYYVSTLEPGQPLSFILIPRALPGVSYRIYHYIDAWDRNSRVKRFGKTGYFVFRNEIFELPVYWFEHATKGAGGLVGTLEFDEQGNVSFKAATEKMQKEFDARKGRPMRSGRASGS